MDDLEYPHRCAVDGALRNRRSLVIAPSNRHIASWNRLGPVALLLVMATGCVTGLAHPLRVPDGPFAEAAISAIGMAGRTGGCDNFQGCIDSDEGGFGFNIQLSGGYGVVLADTFGILGGLYMPAAWNMKAPDGDGFYSTLAAYSFFTVQCPWGSLGAGPEVGIYGWALTVGGEVRPWGGDEDLPWAPALGVYARTIWPFEERPDEFNGEVPSWEVGGRLTVGMAFLQYAAYVQTQGAMNFTIYETSVYASTLHIVSVGISVDFFGLDKFD
jgi:hypothetical protein